MPDRGDDFPCVNEEYGLECEYPFCDCEGEYYEDKIEELPELFEHAEWPDEDDWPIDDD